MKSAGRSVNRDSGSRNTANESRDAYFERGRRETADYYLADPANPYRQSGKSGGAQRWEITRCCIAEAVNGDGDYMDIGCANGLLLESLIEWSALRGFRITPHGIDFVPELVELAKQRLPRWADNFQIANVFHWKPRRRYRFVQTLLESVPPDDQSRLVDRLLREVVADGGRLIVPIYGLGDTAKPEVARGVLEDMGFAVTGSTACVSASVAWIDRPASPAS